MSEYVIDINVDVGEGVGNESQLLPLVSSCNIACGGHAGDLDSMRKVVKLCKTHKVKIGAHPSFPDKAHFGRKVMKISCADLYTSLKHQIRSLMLVLREEQMNLLHIKPHGALYNLAAVDEKTAAVIIEVMKSISLPLKLYVPFGSVIAKMAEEEKIPILVEAFADRNYNEDLTLVSRHEAKAIIVDPNNMFDHIFRIISQGKVKTLSGVEVVLNARTFCVHGDHPDAVNTLQKLVKKLTQNNVKII